MRVRALNALTEALRETLESMRRDGRLATGVDPMATAGVLVSMLAHVSAHRYGFEFWGIRTTNLQDSLTGIVYTTMTGRKPPVVQP